MIVFRPFKGEVLSGKIIAQSAKGLQGQSMKLEHPLQEELFANIQQCQLNSSMTFTSLLSFYSQIQHCKSSPHTTQSTFLT